MPLEAYLLDVGNADFKRMTLLSSIYTPYNKKFLLDNGLTNTTQVADIGCGPGSISGWLAKNVTHKGMVTAIDNSDEQLAIMQNQINLHKIPNIQIAKGNIYDLSEFHERFDLIFCRFIFVHLTHPIIALEELYRILKPGGKLIIAELDNATWYSYPYNQYLQKDMELLCKVGEINGRDLRFGFKLYTYLKNLSFKKISVEISQPILDSSEHREYLVIKAQMWGKKYLAHGLITKDELHDLIEHIEELTEDRNYMIAGAKMFQVCGEKI